MYNTGKSTVTVVDKIKGETVIIKRIIWSTNNQYWIKYQGHDLRVYPAGKKMYDGVLD